MLQKDVMARQMSVNKAKGMKSEQDFRDFSISNKTRWRLLSELYSLMSCHLLLLFMDKVVERLFSSLEHIEAI